MAPDAPTGSGETATVTAEKAHVDFARDLERIICQEFDRQGIHYENNMRVGDLAASFFEMLNRRIGPNPRRVHFSSQLHDSLGALARKAELGQQEAADAWNAVFRIQHLLVEGQNVNPFLHKGIKSATGKASRDGLLWDFGMHHFHLSSEFEKSGFVRRSDNLLYAIITLKDAYFVDVRPHPKSHDLGWVRQDLLRIVHANWPKLIEPWILRGAKGDVLTDQERARLREKNANVATDLGGHAVAPLGGGMTAAGSSILCRRLADELMHEIERHQAFFDTQSQDLRLGLKNSGIATDGTMEFDLVLLEQLGAPKDALDALRADSCLSKRLDELGLAVVERTTRFPIVVTCVQAERL